MFSAVTSSKEEEARWTEEENLQDSQQPFGGSAGGLYRWCAWEEVNAPQDRCRITTIERLFMAVHVNQLSSFPLLALLCDLVLHGVKSNYCVEIFLVWLLICDNCRTLEERSTETIIDAVYPDQNYHPFTGGRRHLTVRNLQIRV